MDRFTTFFASNKHVSTWISIAIGLPSTLLYCAEIWTILWHKPFHNSFYTLFCVRASTDLLFTFTFTSYFFIRLPILSREWFLHLELPNWLLTFCEFICGYTLVTYHVRLGGLSIESRLAFFGFFFWITLYFALSTGNALLTTLTDSQYTLVMDFACPENWSTGERWSTRKGGQRGKLVNGKVVNAENWSMRKSGQRGKVVNGKLVNMEKSAKMPCLSL